MNLSAKYRLLIVLFSGWATVVVGQLSRTINWPVDPIKAEQPSVDSEPVYYIQFDHGGGSHRFSGLPLYSENIVPSGGLYSYTLSNTRFEPLQSPNIAKVKSITDSLPERVEVSSVLSYDRKQPRVVVSFVPLRRNPSNGLVERLVSFDLVPSSTIREKLSGVKLKSSASSVLSNGTWYKVKVVEDGIYKITYEQMVSLGMTNPSDIRVYGNCGGQLPYIFDPEKAQDDLMENPLYMHNGIDGVFGPGDFILFYAQSVDRWDYDATAQMYLPLRHDYSFDAFYFLTTSKGPGKRVSTTAGTDISPSITIDNYIAVAHHEKDLYNFLKSGRGWAGELFESGSIGSVGFTLPTFKAGSQAKARVVLLARAPNPSNTAFTTIINGVPQPTVINISGIWNIGNPVVNYANEKTGIYTFSPSSNNVSVGFTMAATTPSAQGWLNNITLNVPCQLTFAGNPLFIRDYRYSGQIVQWEIGNAPSSIMVWDVTDPSLVSAMPITTSGTDVRFKGLNNPDALYVAFDPLSVSQTPIFSGTGLGLIENQDLHGLPVCDYLIVSHPDFLSQAQRLAEIHRSINRLKVEVVDVNMIYNEFSSGTRDAVAIRNFIKHQYDKYPVSDPHSLKYVLLFGDGSYNNKDDFAGNTNFIPTYQSVEWLNKVSTFVSDDFYALLDDGEGIVNTNLDIGLGRFICRNIGEATMMVDKVEEYLRPDNFGPWQNRMLMIGDDEDSNGHMDQANKIANQVLSLNPAINVKKVLLDAYSQVNGSSGPSYPDVNRIINEQMANGILLFNYNGHGGEGGLAQEGVLSRTIINRWTNGVRRPVFITATCEFGRFDDYANLSGGELVYMNEKGGAVAIFTTNRVVYASYNFNLNIALINALLTNESEGARRSLGESMRVGKNNAINGSSNNLKFGLYGDPAISLAYPLHHVVVDSINGHDLTGTRDTVSAFDRIKVCGHIEDVFGNPLTTAAGYVYPEFYDKQKTYKTLSNDGGDPYSYTARENLLFKGKSSIKDGRFTSEFILPKDIDYSIGSGKFNIYFSASGQTGSGWDTTLVVGGTSTSTLNDNIGPDIQLYLNDPNFINGGLTNQDPVVVAMLTDSSGINITGSGIGHDISVILDNKVAQTYVLNNFYEGEADSYMAGSVRYPLFSLENGPHQLKLKAWDIANNSSEEMVDFTVASDAAMALDHVFNYPNPFTQFTEFYFEHNQPGTSVDVLIQVFTVSGRLVKTIEQSFFAEGFRPNAIRWDGRDDYGDKIGRGVYIYKIKVRTADGKKAEKIERLVILN